MAKENQMDLIEHRIERMEDKIDSKMNEVSKDLKDLRICMTDKIDKKADKSFVWKLVGLLSSVFAIAVAIVKWS